MDATRAKRPPASALRSLAKAPAVVRRWVLVGSPGAPEAVCRLESLGASSPLILFGCDARRCVRAGVSTVEADLFDPTSLRRVKLQLIGCWEVRRRASAGGYRALQG